MTFYFYQICLLIFLLQGVFSPVLLVVAGLLWRRQSRKLESLRPEIENLRAEKVKAGKFKSDGVYESFIRRLPKLKPLKCTNCGAGAALRETEVFCPHCHARAALPEDYAATVSLKAQAKDLLKSALRHWRAANVLTHPLIRWSFFILIFIEPLVLFPAVLIGSNVFPDTWFDRAFESIGAAAAFAIMLTAFLGFIHWMIIFILLSNLSKSLRSNLPLIPAAAADLKAAETGKCQACGGAIEYDGGDFACLCSYCNVENFRVQFARRAHLQAAKHQKKTKSALFGAMEIIEDFTGTFFFVSLILGVASILLVIVSALKE